jgi:hypothetical protein
MGAYYFLTCLLPPLPPTLGEKLTLPFPELSRIVRRHILPSDDALLRAQLSVIDASNWESLEQGRLPFQEGGMLSREEMEARQNLPYFIRNFLDEKERGIRRAHVYDRLWELCYRSLLAQAEEEGCRYLLDYVPWEIELRNRLAALRLRESGRNAEEHTVLSGIRSTDFTALLSPLEGQKNPLNAERFLDGERLKHIYHCQGIDPFSLDTLLAFLSRAMIYDRWAKMQAPYDVNTFLYSGG